MIDVECDHRPFMLNLLASLLWLTGMLSTLMLRLMMADGGDKNETRRSSEWVDTRSKEVRASHRGCC